MVGMGMHTAFPLSHSVPVEQQFDPTHPLNPPNKFPANSDAVFVAVVAVADDCIAGGFKLYCVKSILLRKLIFHHVMPIIILTIKTINTVKNADGKKGTKE